MGLDITAYRALSKVEDAATDADGNPEAYDTHWRAHPVVVAFTEENWPGRSQGIEPGAIYVFGEIFDFRAGSYGGYNQWRDELARFAGYGSALEVWESDRTEGPFLELINFADNEGVIGPVVAAKLAKDFQEFQSKADQEESWWRSSYANWRRAFEMAADNGAVVFH